MKHPILFIMGVSGSGKSTVGRALSTATGIPFFDGDDYHPEANVEKMSAGIALTDKDRAVWLSRLNELAREQARKNGAIIACSALKQHYRDTLAEGLGTTVQWVYLQGDLESIRTRLEQRRGHFMPPSLLRSQFETLEPPQGALTLDIRERPEILVARIKDSLFL